MDDLALHSDTCVDAYPLGRPVDGSDRYGMTPEQAMVYAHLVMTKSSSDDFKVDFRAVADAVGISLANVHDIISYELFKRRWVDPDFTGPVTRYRFVHPVMRFKVPTRDGLKRSNAHKVVA